MKEFTIENVSKLLNKYGRDGTSFLEMVHLLNESAELLWVDVNDRLPTFEDADENGYVLVYLSKNRQNGWANCKGGAKWSRVNSNSHTHWMSFPKKPKTYNYDNRSNRMP